MLRLLYFVYYAVCVSSFLKKNDRKIKNDRDENRIPIFTPTSFSSVFTDSVAIVLKCRSAQLGSLVILYT
jgi:hypothetical protein